MCLLRCVYYPLLCESNSGRDTKGINEPEDGVSHFEEKQRREIHIYIYIYIFIYICIYIHTREMYMCTPSIVVWVEIGVSGGARGWVSLPR